METWLSKTVEPAVSRLAEAVLAVALYRSLEGGAADRLGQPGRLFFYRATDRAEIDFLALPQRLAAEAKYVDTASTRETHAMAAHCGGGLLLTHSAIDLQPGVTILPTAVFTWLLDQPG